jgi:hypothetical protein
MRHAINYHEGDSRPIILSKRSLPIGTCKANKDNGTACQCYAMKGQVFCHSHLAQGYGLFTLAVMAQVGTVSIQRMENRDNG